MFTGDMDLGTVLPASNSLDSSKMLRQNSLKQLSGKTRSRLFKTNNKQQHNISLFSSRFLLHSTA